MQLAHTGLPPAGEIKTSDRVQGTRRFFATARRYHRLVCEAESQPLRVKPSAQMSLKYLISS
jgi:hypothetical protein